MIKSQTVNAADWILDIALDAGAQSLQNGAETYRTEDTMISIANSLGASSASAFVTPTVAMLTCVDSASQSHTRIQRISSRTINLGKIARINELSRRLAARNGRADLGQTEALLSRIRGAPLHHPAGVVLATALSSFCFALLFLGSLREALIALCIGALMRLVLFSVGRLSLSSFIISMIGGSVISLLSGIAVSSALVSSAGNISIAVLMSLVPGLAIVNAIRDIISGDLVAGSARVLEAFVIAAALSVGTAFGLLLLPAGSAGSSSLLLLTNPVPAFFLALGATAAFAWFFYISRYDILWSSLCGALGWLVFLLVTHGSGNGTAGYLAGALCVGLLAEFCAVLFRKPATVYIVPGIIPLVPGGGMYETMLQSVWGNMDAAAVAGFRTLSAAAAVAVGIAIASSAARTLMKLRSTARSAIRR